MIRYYLQLRTLSPLSITRHNNIVGLPNPSLTYIPGATLRGAIAWQQLQADPQAASQPTFQQLFDQEQLHCAPLYPLPATSGSELPLPIPLTARTCKHAPGFRQTPSPLGRGHGVWDTLVPALEEQARLRLAQSDPTVSTTTWAGLGACNHCGYANCTAPLQRFPGHFTWEPPTLQKSAPAQRLLARTALLPTLESARPGALFTREAIDAGQSFAGFITVDATQTQTIETLLAPGTHLYIGAGRTAGLGKVEITVLDRQWNPLTQLLGPLPARLTAFANSLPVDLRSRWAFAPLTLLTDLILLDPYLRAATAPTPAILAHYLALNHALDPVTPLLALPAGLELFLAVNATKRVAGWNTATTPRPRHDDLAIAAGSVFVLAAPPGQLAALTALCQVLEEAGLGERRAEGFGQVAVAFPFHSQTGVL